MNCFLFNGIGINNLVYAPQKARCFMPLGNMSQVGCNQLGAILLHQPATHQIDVFTQPA